METISNDSFLLVFVDLVLRQVNLVRNYMILYFVCGSFDVKLMWSCKMSSYSGITHNLISVCNNI